MTSRLAHPVAEQVGGQARVAELADVRAGVGQPDEHPLAAEQPGDRLGIVVRERRAEAGLEVLVERDVEHHVDRGDAALVRELDDVAVDELGVRGALGHLERVPVRPEERLVVEVRDRPLAPRGIGVALEPHRVGLGHQLRERGRHVERERLAQVHLEHERADRHLRPDLAAFGPGRVVVLG